MTNETDAAKVFKDAMVDAARARGGAGAEFIARGETNLWLDIARDAFLSIAAEQRANSTDSAGVVGHFSRMMEATANYIEPTTYIARHPKGEICKHNTDFQEPDKYDSPANAENKKRRRDQAFINDIIYMLDGPEQRAALSATPEPIDGPRVPGGYALAVQTIAEYFAKLADMDPNEHPHYTSGWRPFSSGDVKHYAEVFAKMSAMLAAAEKEKG